MTSPTPTSFGSIHIVEPSTQHTHTAIFLHGRGSTGDEFADEFFDTLLADQTSIKDHLPSWRWVFPSSRELWSTAFQEDMPAWFEAHSLTDITDRQELQLPGIKASVAYLHGVLREEITRLNGGADRLVLGGISQGAAIGLWTLLSFNQTSPPVGAFVGASAWLPLAAEAQAFFCQDSNQETSNQSGSEVLIDQLMSNSNQSSRGATRLLLGHGTDDAYVDIELGRQARDIGAGIGLDVSWKEYEGAEQEGHWYKSPEQMDDILRFLKTTVQ